MSMDVTFLGTGAAYPSPTRGASALVLRCEGECWLFDCGEGTQTQLMKSQLKAGDCAFGYLIKAVSCSASFSWLFLGLLPRNSPDSCIEFQFWGPGKTWTALRHLATPTGLTFLPFPSLSFHLLTCFSFFL